MGLYNNTTSLLFHGSSLCQHRQGRTHRLPPRWGASQFRPRVCNVSSRACMAVPVQGLHVQCITPVDNKAPSPGHHVYRTALYPGGLEGV
eukprot:1179639-Prorocentrum_minimum.AAC.3